MFLSQTSHFVVSVKIKLYILFLSSTEYFPSSGIRPYKCKECDADFIDNRALKKHTLKVHGFETEGGICKELGLEIIKTANRRKTILFSS